MTDYSVFFPEKLFTNLQEFLTSREPNETGCFLLAHHYATKEKHVTLTVASIIKPESNSWNYEGQNGLEPNSAFINNSVVKADCNKSSLIFVHTHPNELHPLNFSPIDEQTNEVLLVNLSEILEKKPVGSIVFSKHGAHGVILHKGEMKTILKMRIIGKKYYDLQTGNHRISQQPFNGEFDRQIKAIGKTTQSLIQESEVSIVGVGGTGSAVAVQLARMCIK